MRKLSCMNDCNQQKNYQLSKNLELSVEFKSDVIRLKLPYTASEALPLVDVSTNGTPAIDANCI